jgi:hypothetical protein
VHLANPRVTKERMRRWTGFAVALTVTIAVCDAQQIGLSPSDGSLLSLKTLTSLRMVRPEQKAPPVIAPLRFSNQAFASRKQAAGTFRYFDGSKCFRYALISPGAWSNALCSQVNSDKRTRDPPRMDPPFFC